MKESFPLNDLPQRIPPEEPIAIEDVEDAREWVQARLASGIKPIITMPVDFFEKNATYGIPPLSKVDLRSKTGFSIIAGTLGREPLLPVDEERVVCEIDPAGLRIEPRMTGADHSFHGVVAFLDPIPPTALREIERKNGSKGPEERPSAFMQKEPPLH